MASERLPGKVLRPILGRPMLEHLLERARRARTLDDVVVATTTRADDDAIAELCARVGAGCHRGSEHDVLRRVLDAADAFEVDVIAQLTGDNPLVDPDLIDRAVAAHAAGGVDYVSNTLELTYPLGINVQVFTRAVLADVDARTDDPRDREHVSLHIYEHPDRYRLLNLTSDLPPRWWGVRMTVDEPDDLRLVTTVFERLHPANPSFTTADVVALLDAEPSIAEINAHISQRPAR
jgi:spore coat polysaccharide biosynthesis protein SpsF